MQRACSLQGPTHAARPARRTDRITPRDKWLRSFECWRDFTPLRRSQIISLLAPAVDVPSPLVCCTTTPWCFVSVDRAFGEDVQTHNGHWYYQAFEMLDVSFDRAYIFYHKHRIVWLQSPRIRWHESIWSWNHSEKKISEDNAGQGFSILSWLWHTIKVEAFTCCHFVSQLMLVRAFVNMNEKREISVLLKVWR